ncbi:hypothetical protein [Nitratireductor sp. GCM10026969]|uniref:hypothetical protein n=1 Tax=Nitratireductor sp. GCM10026969 TaxID=3252645 RepID=UPI00361742F3
MRKYRKAIAAVIGVSALAVLRQMEVDVFGLDHVVLELVVSALTAWGVYQVPNAG